MTIPDASLTARFAELGIAALHELKEANPNKLRDEAESILESIKQHAQDLELDADNLTCRWSEQHRTWVAAVIETGYSCDPFYPERSGIGAEVIDYAPETLRADKAAAVLREEAEDDAEIDARERRAEAGGP